MSGGGGGGSQTATSYTSNVPEYAKGAFMDLVGKAEALSNTPYTPYSGDRQAQFTPLQQQAFNATAQLGPSQLTQQAGGIASLAAQQGFGMQYAPSQVNMTNAPSQVVGGAAPAQISGPGQGMQVGAQQISGPNAGAVPGVNVPGQSAVQQVQGPGSAQQVGTQSFTQQGTAQQFMNPYMQNVVNIQQREAVRADDIARQRRNASAVAAGAFGGSRQALVEAEAARNLSTQLGDIQAQGLNQSYQQAMQQFNAEQGLGLQAQQSNQRAGLDTSQMGLQAALANQRAGMDLTNQQIQAQQANQQAGLNLQQLGLTAQTANQRAGLEAALANQQSGLNYAQLGQQAQTANQRAGLDYNQQLLAAQQANQRAGLDYGQQFLDAQRMAEASRQFGANYGLEGLRSSLQAGQLMGQLGGQEFDQASNALQMQYGMGAQQQQAIQRMLDQQYGDFQAQRDYPYQQIGFLSDILRGSGGSTRSVYPGPSTLQTIAGLGTAAMGLKGMKRGGRVKAGLADIAPDMGEYAEGGVVGYADGGDVDRPAIYRRPYGPPRPGATAQPSAEPAASKVASRGLGSKLMRGAGMLGAGMSVYDVAKENAENTQPRQPGESSSSFFARMAEPELLQYFRRGAPPAAAAAVPAANEVQVPDEPPLPMDSGSGTAYAATGFSAPQVRAPGPLTMEQIEAGYKPAQDALAADQRALEASNAGIVAAQRAAADKALANFDARVAAEGEAGLERLAAVQKQQKALEGREGRAKNEALVQAGLAILAADPSRGAWAAIGQGMGVGFKQYRGDIADLEERKAKLDEQVLQVQELRRAERIARGDKREALQNQREAIEVEAKKGADGILRAMLPVKTAMRTKMVDTYFDSIEKAANRQLQAGIANAENTTRAGVAALGGKTGRGWMQRGSDDYMEEVRKRVELASKSPATLGMLAKIPPEQQTDFLYNEARKSVDADIARYMGGRVNSGPTASPGANQGWQVQR